MTKLRLGLIYGGKSGEHEISIKTAFSVSNSLDFNKYTFVPIYITKSGNWIVGKEQCKALNYEEIMNNLENGTFENLKSSFPSDLLFREKNDSVSNIQALDIIFPLIHGTFGEDGKLQGLLEMANIPYVGCGVLASSVGMDKSLTKTTFAQAGLPQCKYLTFTKFNWDRNKIALTKQIRENLNYPCFVKPANAGSSLGVSKVRMEHNLDQAIEEAFKFDRKVIVEEEVIGREIEIAILGNYDEPSASVPGEIIQNSDFYDFETKYLNGGASLSIPAEISQNLTEKLKKLAKIAFQAIDGSGLSRVDFFVTKNEEVYINEINTMPGFTPVSMYPLLWQESGKSYSQLLDELIQLGIDRFKQSRNLSYKF
ncbi:D-alanine--D-alanine ligase B [Conidiobolus coronatus NRRL 28638]|uniref:D-alanine--D-alanine ligase B n=1 Tax=Conidiobolus coronatus (strain ATCC 28846 / CBS 209.66 / NRRL 28638) TaxID=796925 RepID=A0A137PHV4_CONC2|nr:D-alanine--D-alanine ligase B [Conidiobolus coronatus NRRL 28638]|eukprot:KXN74578.1 D-alanine--D-alanine ligase B [Conidiobolus coronatus NRRL 28638]